MSTGAVVPFTPAQPTQMLGVTATSQALAFVPDDVLLIYNAGANDIFITLGESTTGLTAVIPTSGTPQNGFWVKAGTMMIVGTPSGGTFVPSGQGGSPPQRISALAAIAAVAGPTSLYFTPGAGTEKGGT